MSYNPTLHKNEEILIGNLHSFVQFDKKLLTKIDEKSMQV